MSDELRKLIMDDLAWQYEPLGPAGPLVRSVELDDNYYVDSFKMDKTRISALLRVRSKKDESFAKTFRVMIVEE